MNKLLFIPLLTLFPLISVGQQKQQDSLAIILIDRMTDVIGDMESCSFNLHVVNDVEDSGKIFRKQFTDFAVYLSGQDKMLIKISGEKGPRQIWYNGSQVAYYFRNEQNYGIVDAPSNTITMMDSFHHHYGIQFPAADFFFPTFTDDLLAQATLLTYIGRAEVDGQDCFHLLADNNEMTYQLWISSDVYNLPAAFSITYKNKPGNPQYQAYFSDWQVNPVLPAAMFDFQSPPGSVRVRMMSRSDR